MASMFAAGVMRHLSTRVGSSRNSAGCVSASTATKVRLKSPGGVARIGNHAGSPSKDAGSTSTRTPGQVRVRPPSSTRRSPSTDIVAQALHSAKRSPRSPTRSTPSTAAPRIRPSANPPQATSARHRMRRLDALPHCRPLASRPASHRRCAPPAPSSIPRRPVPCASLARAETPRRSRYRPNTTNAGSNPNWTTASNFC